MYLDNLKLRSIAFQVNYPVAYEIWDSAGEIARKLIGIWPGLKLQHGEPNRQFMVGDGVTVRSEAESAVAIFDAEHIKKISAEARSHQIRDAFAIWRTSLNLSDLNRVSMRVQYYKDYSSTKDVVKAMSELNCCKFPTPKVFDQPLDGERNNVDTSFRWEDDKSFALLRIYAESAIIKRVASPEIPEDADIKREQFRLVVDFDRGFISPIKAKDLRVEEWIKGYFHVLRRDIDKILLGTR
jgi:hypothetical protein